ncbi:MAG: hypothetical protein QM731_22445 [Chitinophagaceae bacterium]
MTAYKKPLCLLIAAVAGLGISELRAQNLSSPYSVYGIGDIDHKAYNRTSGMGSTGLAVKSNTYIINNNPAAIAGLERSFYVIDLGATGGFTTYKGDPVSSSSDNTSKDFIIKRLALAVKLNKFWASSVGFRQYSYVNYSFLGSKFVEGSTSSYPTVYTGDGGLNDFYWTNAVSLGKHFNLGVKASYLTGSVDQSESFIEGSSNATIISKQSDYYHHVHLEYGAQFFTNIAKKWDIAIGAKYVRKIKFSPDRSLTVTQNSTTIYSEDFLKTDAFTLPDTYGIGLAVTKNNKITFAADYTFERWSALKPRIGGSNWLMQDAHRVSAGLEFSRQVVVWNQPVEKRFFQIGGFFDNSGLTVRGNSINNIGGTIGTGGSYRGLLYNVVLEGGTRGTKSNGLIKENYVQLTFNLSYRDFLASKGRKYN